MKKNSAGLATVFLAVLIDLMGFGIVLPLLPFYASIFHVSAFQIGLLYSIYSLAQLIFSPVWGGLSDRVGRRPIMLISTFGSSLAYLMFAFSTSFGILFVSRLIAGIMGGNISTAQAYVADVTSTEDRAKGMGMIGAAFGIGFVLGPALAGLLTLPFFLNMFHITENHRFILPGIFASFLSFTSFLLVWFKLPEPEKKMVEVSNDQSRIVKNSIFGLAFWANVFEEKRYAKHLFPALMLCMFLLSFGQSSLYTAFPLFSKDALKLSSHDVVAFFVYIGFMTAFVQGYLIRKLTKKYSEEMLFLVGSTLMVIGFLLIPISPSKAALGWVLCLLSIGLSLNGPTLTSLISKESDPSQVGRVMGTAQGISGLGRVIGPTWGGFFYGISYRLPFLLTGAVLLITIYSGIELCKAHHAFTHPA